jgi:hypothetical protein
LPQAVISLGYAKAIRRITRACLISSGDSPSALGIVFATVPGLGVGSAQQISAKAASQKHLSSWVGACPGDEESAGVSKSHRSPKRNRHMRRILNQCANAAVRAKRSIFEMVYRRLVPRLGHNQTIGAIAHQLCRLIWNDSASKSPLRETGPSRVRKVEASTHGENDPAAPKSWLPGRTADCSTRPSMMPAWGRDFRPCRQPMG